MRVPCDAGTDDDGRCNIEPLAGEIDRLNGLDAFQLVDGQGMAIDTAAAERRVTWPSIIHAPKGDCWLPGFKQSGREINTVGVPLVDGQQWAAILLELHNGRRAREQEAEKLRPHWPNETVLEIELADGVVLAQPLHRRPEAFMELVVGRELGGRRGDD